VTRLVARKEGTPMEEVTETHTKLSDRDRANFQRVMGRMPYAASLAIGSVRLGCVDDLLAVLDVLADSLARHAEGDNQRYAELMELRSLEHNVRNLLAPLAEELKK
jgi:hypothetical protein